MYNDTDFLRFDAKLRDTLLKTLESSDLLLLRKRERIDLFLLAFALGVNSPTDLPSYEPLIRGEQVRQRPECNALMSSVVVGSIKDSDSIDEVISRNYIWYYAERCANTGFRLIDDLLKKPDEQAINSLVSDMDDLYEKYIGNLE